MVALTDMLTPLAPNQWDPAKAAHLLNRAGFGGTPAHIDSLVQSGMAASVRYLVDGPANPAPVVLPAWAQPQAQQAEQEQIRTELTGVAAGDPEAVKRQRGEIVRRHRREQEEHTLDLGAWWMDRMRQSVDPLAEKMTLFWHGHFATSAQKVKSAYFFLGQNQTFREQARGNFGVLVKAMSRDPAMIDWLDLKQSRAAHPNENFAREVMELFTLGEGNYTEQDVTEGAKAFTGYRINPRGEFQFNFREHDNSPKIFLGRSDVRDGDQAIDTILAQPACARFLARKLWTFFAYDNPPAPLVEALADVMRANRYEMRPVLHRIFTSEEFYSPLAVRTQIKSPVQWMVETARTLEVELPPRGPLLGALRQMGQVPFYPPSVKGWDGGKAWISTSTLLTRYNFAGALLNIAPRHPQPAPLAPPDNADSMMLTEEGEPMAAPAPALITVARQVDYKKIAPPEWRGNPNALVQMMAMRLFQGSPSVKDEAKFVEFVQAAGPQANDATIAGLLHLMMSTPSFQLC